MNVKEKIKKNNERRIKQIEHLLKLDPSICDQKHLIDIIMNEAQIRFNNVDELKELNPTIFKITLDNMTTEYDYQEEELIDDIIFDIERGDVHDMYFDISKEGWLSVIIHSHTFVEENRVITESPINHLLNLHFDKEEGKQAPCSALRRCGEELPSV